MLGCCPTPDWPSCTYPTIVATMKGLCRKMPAGFKVFLGMMLISIASSTQLLSPIGNDSILPDDFPICKKSLIADSNGFTLDTSSDSFNSTRPQLDHVLTSVPDPYSWGHPPVYELTAFDYKTPHLAYARAEKLAFSAMTNLCNLVCIPKPNDCFCHLTILLPFTNKDLFFVPTWTSSHSL